MSEQSTSVPCAEQEKTTKGNAARHDDLFRSLLAIGVFRVDQGGKVWRCKRRGAGEWLPLPAPRRSESRTTDGYMRVGCTISKEHKTIGSHRVVWMAYGNSITPEAEINHKNGDRSDNRIENLELVTAGDNQRHCYRVLGRTVDGEKNGRHKLTERDVLEIRDLATSTSISALSRQFGVSRTAIRLAVVGKNWKHLGGQFQSLALRQSPLAVREPKGGAT